MTTLEIITVILAAISIISGVIFGITSWRASRASVERAKAKILVDSFDFATAIKSGASSMKKELSAKEREVITRIVWRSSGVSLVHILSNLRERHYLFQALADPSEYPWENEGSDNTT